MECRFCPHFTRKPSEPLGACFVNRVKRRGLTPGCGIETNAQISLTDAYESGYAAGYADGEEHR